jgi:hypothetical protein
LYGYYKKAVHGSLWSVRLSIEYELGHGRVDTDCSPVGQIGVVGHPLPELSKASGANDRLRAIFSTAGLFGAHVIRGRDSSLYRIGDGLLFRGVLTGEPPLTARRLS